MWCNHVKYLWEQFSSLRPLFFIKHITHTWVPRLQSLPLHYPCLGSLVWHPLMEEVVFSAVELGLKGVDGSWVFKQENSSPLVRAARFADPNLFFCRENESITVICVLGNADAPVSGLWKLLTWATVYVHKYTCIQIWIIFTMYTSMNVLEDHVAI